MIIVQTPMGRDLFVGEARAQELADLTGEWAQHEHNGERMRIFKPRLTQGFFSLEAGGEYAEFFVHEREPIPRDSGGATYAATWAAYTGHGNYAYHWSSMGEPFAEFIRDIQPDYLLKKIGKKVFSERVMQQSIREHLDCRMRDSNMPKAVADRAWKNVEKLCGEFAGEVLCDKLYNHPTLHKAIDFVDITTQEYDIQCRMFVEKLWPLFVAEVSKRFPAKEKAAT